MGVDEDFQRSDATGSYDLLTDALGSTIALTNSSAALTTRYTYEPFGQVTISGATSSNSFQFTGRENDGTGVYYNRARYYSPTLQRFISPDPMGLTGGDVDLYTYVRNRPTEFSDPSGLKPPCWTLALSTYAIDLTPIPLFSPPPPETPMSAAAAGAGLAAAYSGYAAGVYASNTETYETLAYSAAMSPQTRSIATDLAQSMVQSANYASAAKSAGGVFFGAALAFSFYDAINTEIGAFNAGECSSNIF